LTDLRRYARARAARDRKFAEGLESGYEDFKLGVLIRHAREEAGPMQEEVANRPDNESAPLRIPHDGKK
jgi:hypothetical protein